jgi:hypothetical protein
MSAAACLWLHILTEQPWPAEAAVFINVLEPHRSRRYADVALEMRQARASNGGFFQDNRPLSITDVYADRAGAAKWIEE